jgi:hypothetical protein
MAPCLIYFYSVLNFTSSTTDTEIESYPVILELNSMPQIVDRGTMSRCRNVFVKTTGTQPANVLPPRSKARPKPPPWTKRK